MLLEDRAAGHPVYVIDDYPDFTEPYDGYAIFAFEGNPEDRDC